MASFSYVHLCRLVSGWFRRKAALFWGICKAALGPLRPAVEYVFAQIGWRNSQASPPGDLEEDREEGESGGERTQAEGEDGVGVEGYRVETSDDLCCGHHSTWKNEESLKNPRDSASLPIAARHVSEPNKQLWSALQLVSILIIIIINNNNNNNS